jgi:hypothetical protein
MIMTMNVNTKLSVYGAHICTELKPNTNMFGFNKEKTSLVIITGWVVAMPTVKKFMLYVDSM